MNPQTPQQQPQNNPSGEKHAVLYVDDEEQALKYFKRGFEKDFRVLTANSVAAAMTILEQQAATIGVVISDQKMPGKSGVSMLSEIRQRWPAIVRILTTAYTDMESAVAAVNAGSVYKYVTKPADFNLLRQILSEALAMHHETLHRDALAQTLKELEDQRKATLEAQSQREQMHQQLVTASREAGRAEVATGILHNVGNVLNSMNVSAAVISNTLQESRVDNLLKSLAMIEEHTADLANFIANDDRGQRLPNYLLKLGPVLKQEQNTIAEAMTVLTKSIEHIMHVIRTQQTSAKELILHQPIDPTALIEDAVRVNQPGIDKAGVKLVRDFAPIATASLDQHRVLQILINLIGNAVKALGEAAIAEKQITLRIVTANDGAEILFEVIDNGVGIASENLNRIFTYGFTTRSDGHGFGLHSAANAAREMGGELRVFSDGPGRGAKFTLQLPLGQATER